MYSIGSARPCSKSVAGITLLLMLTCLTPVFAAETVRIFRSTMPDGSVVLGDRPSVGARQVASSTYAITAPNGAAQAEREHWRRQSDAFDLRQRQRDSARCSRHRLPRSCNSSHGAAKG